MPKNKALDTTNVKPGELNYEKYSFEKYDRDIANSIPYHKEIHSKIAKFLAGNFKTDRKYLVLDLGVGTGITSKVVQDALPKSRLDVIDFSKYMLKGARKKLGNNIRYILGDYSKMRFKEKYDIVVCVVGLHHQSNEGKKLIFKKVCSLLKNDGVFIFADLVTYRNRQEAALNQALHFNYLAEHATDQKTLAEWAYHHIFLNNLAPVEDQIKWLKDCGFRVNIGFLKIGTALLFCKK